MCPTPSAARGADPPHASVPHTDFPVSRTNRTAVSGTSLTVRPSEAPRAIEPPILHGLRAMLGGDRLGAGEIGDRASDAQRAIVAACGESEARDGGAEQPRCLGREWTQATELTHREISVQATGLSAEALALDVAGR